MNRHVIIRHPSNAELCALVGFDACLDLLIYAEQENGLVFLPDSPEPGDPLEKIVGRAGLRSLVQQFRGEALALDPLHLPDRRFASKGVILNSRVAIPPAGPEPILGKSPMPETQSPLSEAADKFDPFQIAEAISEAAAQIERQMQAAAVEAPELLKICANVAMSAQRALQSARTLLEQNGDRETALYALACSEGAMRLISGLIETPDDPFMRTMAAPFAGGEQ